MVIRINGAKIASLESAPCLLPNFKSFNICTLYTFLYIFNACNPVALFSTTVDVCKKIKPVM